MLAVGFFVVMSNMVPEMTQYRKGITALKPFAFKNQDGQMVTNKDVEGKVFAVEYFFTTCPSICPTMNQNMMKVFQKFRNEKDFLILSHTSDPEIDNPARLKVYADSLGATGNWIFLTGRKDSLYRMARTSYDIDDKKNYVTNLEDEFLHTQFFALVNKKGEVLPKKYDGLKPSEVEEMIRDIEKLLEE